jgi:hypothetical protein
MKWFKRIILALLLLFVVFLAGAYLLPSEVSLSRSVVINAPAEKIFPHVNSLKKFQAWSPWAHLDKNMKLVFSGPEAGVGQVASWQSKDRNVGTGSQKIVESITNKRVVNELDFGEMGKANSAIELLPQADGTKVVWRFQTKMGRNPLMRWMGLMFDKWVGKDYEKGLGSLKTIVEKEQ